MAEKGPPGAPVNDLYDAVLNKYKLLLSNITAKIVITTSRRTTVRFTIFKCGKAMNPSEKEKYLSRNYQRKEEQRKSDSFQYAGITQRYSSGKFQDTNWAGVTTGRLP